MAQNQKDETDKTKVFQGSVDDDASREVHSAGCNILNKGTH